MTLHVTSIVNEKYRRTMFPLAVYIFVLCLEGLMFCGRVQGAENLPVVISEFMAANDSTLQDEDGDFSDWIEIENKGNTTVSLAGWSLTDDSDDLRKWVFPAVTLGPQGFRVVFASDKDRRDVAGKLHTNFKLKSEGEYLALIQPDGLTRATEFSPVFPPQRDDISYGSGIRVLLDPLVPAQHDVRVWVPPHGNLGDSWTGGGEPFDDSTTAGWIQGSGGVGFVSAPQRFAPLGYWSFDDASSPNVARDSSGHGLDGQVASQSQLNGGGGTGKPVYTADSGGHTGMPGDRAMDFGTANSGAIVKVLAAEQGAFDSIVVNDKVTISLWIFGGSDQPANDSSFWATNAANGSGERSLGAHVPWSDQTIYWDTGSPSPGISRVSKLETDTTKWKGRWNHYVFLKNGNVKQIWQNGALFLDGNNTAPIPVIRYFAIGAGDYNGSMSYGGKVDDFAIWDRALTPEQIQALAAGLSPLDLTEESPMKKMIETDLDAVMRGKATSAYLRIPFNVTFPLDFNTLLLNLNYDDGFVAWLNGVECARQNAPSLPVFNSVAETERSPLLAFEQETFDLSAHIGDLRSGENVLALQGLTRSTSCTEFLISGSLNKAIAGMNQYLDYPTPSEPNQGGYLGFVDKVAVFPGRGFYDQPILVNMQSATPGAIIRYTLDGTAPTETSGTLYTGPVSISKTSVLRVAAFKPGFRPGDVETQTYLYLEDVVRQPILPDGFPANWGDGPGVVSPLTDKSDYEMDPDVVNNVPLKDRDGLDFNVQDALRGIPTLSLVWNLDDLFGRTRGLHPNATQSGEEWERRISVEWIDPEGAEGFQADCGIRMHGGWNRFPEMLKKAFRLYFRSEYGTGKLKYRLFPDSPVESFDKLVLRSGNGEVWPSPWRSEGALSVCQYIRDQFGRDCQRDMGGITAHGRFVHLYINGLYWGLYNLTERPDADFMESYLENSPNGFDIINFHRGTGPSALEGDLTAWNTLINLAGQGVSTPAAYDTIQQYLDIESFIDYMIMEIFIGNWDWQDNNVYAGRKREAGAGFYFFCWDTEEAVRGVNDNLTGANVGNTCAYIYDQLRANPEFRLRFADHLRRHLFNQGALTPQACDARWMYWAERLDRPMVAESARWGDRMRPDLPFTRDADWLPEQRRIRFQYFTVPAGGQNRTQVVLGQFRTAGLYPSVEAPDFNQYGGVILPGFKLAMTSKTAGGKIYYTTDGTDPRVPQTVTQSAGLSPTAIEYTGLVPLSATQKICARTFSAGTWSALTEAVFSVKEEGDDKNVVEWRVY